ncbi:tetratricopeptide repeat protein [Roseobacter sp. EG26]|uniref:tetratricopeptide repeat protein n=1 Tax=Roseobacter sp. EG26 TaxID=3412477 RepID=UPI003CE4F3B0
MFAPTLSKSALAAAVFLALAGCKSDADRAEEYFQSGLALIESGDTDRAMVQFRNVFEFDKAHLPTRQTMAELFMTQGNPRAAYGQYLAIAEQYPENFEARRALAELAFEAGNWDEFIRHGTVAVELSAEDPRVQAISLGLKYREAALAEDDPALQALTAPTETLLATLPDSNILNRLLMDRYARDGALSKALERMDVLLAAAPDDRVLYTQRLGMLGQMQDLDAIEVQLRDMVKRFPGDTEIQRMMLRFFVSQQKLEDAEAFLREISDPADENPGLFVNLIQFVSQVHGEDAARVEIERAIAVNPNPNRFKAMLALMDFQAGEQDKAIAEMEAIVEQSDANEEDSSGFKATLARMLVNTGNQVGARRLVEEVLEQNPSAVDALKMQASWQLQADETDAAIANLRLALDTAPEDVQAMNLMYEAHTRTGETDLARDFLAQAVEASGNAPETSLRYARVLIQEGRLFPAEDVLLPALRQSPGNLELLTVLGDLYLRMEDLPRANQVIDTLRRLDTEQSRNVANGLQAQALNQEGGTEQAMQFLEELSSGEDAGLRERLVLMRARLQVGEVEEAQRMAQALVAENPENLGLKQALASTQTAAGDLDAAKITLREVTTAAPERALDAWLQLTRIALRQGNPEEADAIIEEALDATNNHPNVMWAKASRLERIGDVDGAIGIYETLYEQNSSAVVVANNLASLLATYKDDADSLERAWVIARRLRDFEVPALQDTYGWVLFRRGDAEGALPYLESAAAGLAEDPVVQAHLGFTYAALERNDEALEQIQKALTIAGPADTHPQIEKARAEMARLRALVEQ